MMKNFIFKSPTELVLGNGVTEELGIKLKKLNVNKVTIVTDEVIVKFGIYNKIVEALNKENIEHVVFSEVQPEPPVENAYDAFELYKANDCNGVLGVGGGSSMDVAKAVAMLATNPGKYEDYVGIGKVPNKCAPLVLMPTTSGTGSEVSVFSIMIVNGSKAGVVDKNILADIAIVDPTLTLTVPRAITAATGLDALCHHIESYLSVNYSPICDAICLEGIRTIGKYLRKAVGNGNDQEARYWMSYASTLGGFVMNLTDGAAANHGLAFALGAKFHVGHGLSNAVMLPYVLPVVGIAELDRVRKIGEALGANLDGLSDREALNVTVQAISTLVEDVGCKLTMRNFGVTEEDIDSLVDEVVETQGRVMGHSTYVLKPNEIKNIFLNAF
jgi:alcohol dehydrogenase